MKYVYFFGFLCLFSITPQLVFSQQVPDSTEVIEEFEDIESDSLNQNCIGPVTAPLVPFDTTTVPAASLYKSWNHLHVNPYDTDLVKKPDTTFIDLTGYCHPRKNYITSDFGFRRWRHHYGIDLKIQVGDTIQCAFDGMIRICKYSRSYGNYVVVRHYNGLETIYGHLTRSLVSINQQVKAGEPIGLGGSTGRSTGPHLHFEVRYLGQCINPHDIIDFDNYALKSDTLQLSSAHFAYMTEIRKIRYHIVRRGETLGHIAIRYGVPLKRLYHLNHIHRSKLRIGQRIRYT